MEAITLPKFLKTCLVITYNHFPPKISASCGPARNVGLLMTQQKTLSLLYNFHTLLLITVDTNLDLKFKI